MNTLSDGNDQLMRRLFREIGEDEPSEDFTAKVTERIAEGIASSKSAYQPVIGTGGWVLVASFIAVLMVLAVTMTGMDHGQGLFSRALAFDQPHFLRWFENISSGINVVQLRFTPIMKVSMIALTLFGLINIIYMRLWASRHL